MTLHTPPIHIGLRNADNNAPLLELSGSEQYYPANLWIDTRTRSAYWAISYAINSMPMDVWHGIVRWFACSVRFTNVQLIALGEVLGPLVARVCNGAGTKWSGQNWVGVLDEAAQSACDEIEKIIALQEDGVADVVHVGDWLGDTVLRRTRADRRMTAHDTAPVAELRDLDADDDEEDVVESEIEGTITITWTTTNDELDTAAETLDDDAWLQCLTILIDTLSHLHQLRDECVAL